MDSGVSIRGGWRAGLDVRSGQGRDGDIEVTDEKRRVRGDAPRTRLFFGAVFGAVFDAVFDVVVTLVREY